MVYPQFLLVKKVTKIQTKVFIYKVVLILHLSVAEKPSFTEDIECSIKLFPHLTHVRDLTNDFIERAAGVMQIPKDQSFHELMKKDRIKVRRSDTLSSQSLLGSEGLYMS